MRLLPMWMHSKCFIFIFLYLFTRHIFLRLLIYLSYIFLTIAILAQKV